MTEREVLALGQMTLPIEASFGDADECVPVTCARCGQPGAGSLYKGEIMHLSCRMEAKLDDGVLPATSKPTQPRLRGTGSRRGKK